MVKKLKKTLYIVNRLKLIFSVLLLSYILYKLTQFFVILYFIRILEAGVRIYYYSILIRVSVNKGKSMYMV